MTRIGFLRGMTNLLAPRSTFFDVYSEVKLTPATGEPVRIWNIPYTGIKVTGVFLNGVRLCYLTDYTISGNTIVLNSVYEPAVTDIVLLQMSARN